MIVRWIAAWHLTLATAHVAWAIWLLQPQITQSPPSADGKATAAHVDAELRARSRLRAEGRRW